MKIEDLMAEQEDQVHYLHCTLYTLHCTHDVSVQHRLNFWCSLQVNVLTELTVMQSLSHPHLVCYKGAGSLVKSEQQAKVDVCSDLRAVSVIC